VVACGAVLALCYTNIVSTQGRSSAEQQIATLQQQLAALDRRVKELEKTGSNASGPDDAAPPDARVKKLEDALRSLEKRVDSGASGSPGSGSLSRLTVTAPFTVVDRAGKTVMSVGEGGNGLSRGAYLHDVDGQPVAHIGWDKGISGGRVYATRPGILPMALLAAAVDGPSLILQMNNKRVFAIDKESLAFYNDAMSPLSVFGTKNRSKGYMELNDGSGSKMVEAGTLNAGVGYVMTNPSRSSVSPSGNPSVLMGRGGR
jgi:hypothetical protein